MNYHIKWIVKQWISQKWFVLIMIFFTLISSAVAIAYPFVFKQLIDLMSDILKFPAKYPAPMHNVNRIVMLFLAIGLAQLITGFYPSFRALMNVRFEHALRMQYFKDITEKDYAFFQKFRTGDIVTRLTDDLSDFPKVAWFMCSGIFRAFNSFSMIAFSLAVMFSLNWLLTLLSIASLPLMMIVFYITSDKLYVNFQRNQEAISNINNQLEMSFSGIRIIKAFVSEDKYNRFFEVALAKRFKTEMSVVKLNAILHLIYEYIDYFAQIGVIIFGGWMAVKGTISIGTFFLFYTYLSMMIYPLLDLPQLFVSGKQCFVNIDRLDEIKNYPALHTHKQNGFKISNLSEIQFNQVSFTYPDKDSPIINECSFNIVKGEKMLILGSTGAGKTTIANLFTGILYPTNGSIFINGKSLQDIDIDSWRHSIGYVPQEALLFTGTIKSNILFSDVNDNSMSFDKAVKISQLENELSSFPLREQTLIGNKGLTLSGGQKQRVTIARALINKPKLLVLDDITASLDADNEEKLWLELDSNFDDITCVVISHRLSTLRYIDSILFIDSNGVCHKGTHDELVFKLTEYHSFIHEHLKTN
jgi:ABC-type bacteriocin/lantibiotic exporter with double-glycine peptidase domain